VKRIFLIVVPLLVAATARYVAPIWREISTLCSEDPTIWEDAIAEFAVRDADSPSPDDAKLLVASSTIRL